MQGYRCHIIKYALLSAGLILGIQGFGFAQTSYEARPESKVWIEGSSTVHDFDCKSDTIGGSAKIPQKIAARDTVSGITGPEIEIEFPVRSFDCGRSRMNRDFYEALNAEEYEAITFDFTGAKKLEADSNNSESYDNYEVAGKLTVSGVTREVLVQVKGQPKDDGTIRIFGAKKISMKDFDIEPPTALMGMVRVHEELVVHFDLWVKSK